MAFKKAPTPKPLTNVDDFISAAGQPVVTEPVPVAVMPWDGLRDDKNTEMYNLRLTERQKAILQYISEKTPDSIQSFCVRAIQEAADAKIKEMTGVDAGF